MTVLYDSLDTTQAYETLEDVTFSNTAFFTITPTPVTQSLIPPISFSNPVFGINQNNKSPQVYFFIRDFYYTFSTNLTPIEQFIRVPSYEHIASASIGGSVSNNTQTFTITGVLDNPYNLAIASLNALYFDNLASGKITINVVEVKPTNYGQGFIVDTSGFSTPKLISLNQYADPYFGMYSPNTGFTIIIIASNTDTVAHTYQFGAFGSVNAETTLTCSVDYQDVLGTIHHLGYVNLDSPVGNLSLNKLIQAPILTNQVSNFGNLTLTPIVVNDQSADFARTCQLQYTLSATFVYTIVGG